MKQNILKMSVVIFKTREGKARYLFYKFSFFSSSKNDDKCALMLLLWNLKGDFS